MSRTADKSLNQIAGDIDIIEHTLRDIARHISTPKPEEQPAWVALPSGRFIEMTWVTHVTDVVDAGNRIAAVTLWFSGSTPLHLEGVDADAALAWLKRQTGQA